MAVAAAALSADAALQVVFQTNGGNKTVMEATGLRVTISDGTLTATNNSETQKLAVAELAKMYFAEGDAESDIREIFASDVLSDIYTISGICIAKSVSADRIATLPAGTYIVKSDSKTFKITVR